MVARPQLTLGAVCLLMLQASTALSVIAPKVPLSARCPDGRIPLNSPQMRCRRLPQLQWAGRQCEAASNSYFSCPRGYSCLSTGLCCESATGPSFQGDLCHMDPRTSNVIEAVGTCTSDANCRRHDSPMSRCCSGKCVLLRQRCFQKLQEYHNIQSTGRMPHQYMPICTNDGAFAPVQWEPRLDLRWCVDPRTGLALRSGCCLSNVTATAAAVNGSSGLCANLRRCPRDLCAARTCPARPDARCRVNPCGGCRVEFVDSAGRPVDCTAGVGQCAAKEFEYYVGLAWLRARDQTQWIQTDVANNPVSRADASLKAAMDTCQPDLCSAYNASKLEPTRPTSGSSSGFGYWSLGGSCPKQDKLGYKCPDKCRIYFSCDKTRPHCCDSGCGRECVKVDDDTAIHESHCSMSISSGHCPTVGCHRMCRRWGYDVAKRTCRAFWYAGVGGNNNRYDSWAECMWDVQDCHGRVWLALPVRPSCSRRGGAYKNVQKSDNAMYWCVNSDGVPTLGTLHADKIRCTSSGTLIKDKYYKKRASRYLGRCAGGAWPAWCHNISTDRTCGTPGVTTFADACNGCRLVHVNAEGQEVACRTDAEVCAASGRTCASPTPRFEYSPATGRCDPAPVATKDECAGTTDARRGYTREAGCQQACAAAWCTAGASPPAFYPDLCISPVCRWPGTVCVPDECAGRERYFLPNGTEAVECARRREPLSLASISHCGTTTVAATTAATRLPPPMTTLSTRTTIFADWLTKTTTKPGSNTTRTKTTAGSPQTTKTTAGSPQTTKTTVSTSTTKTTTARTSTKKTSTTTTAATTTTTTKTPTTTRPKPKTLLSICLIRSHLGVEPMKCRATDGKYEPRQCNATHCFCVVIDTGAVVPDAPVVPIEDAASLECPVMETTNLSLAIRYDADYPTILPTMEDEAKLQRVVIRRFAYEGSLQASHFRLVDLEPGSIVVTVGMEKTPGDSSADLPASSFELKTMALTQTLTLDFNGVTLSPSSRQDFNENSGSAPVPKAPAPSPTETLPVIGGGGGAAAELNIAGIVAGVLITVVVVAVCGVIIAFVLRRRGLMGQAALPHESGDYETMSNASQATGSFAGPYDNFANRVYAPVEDVYDNIAQPASSA